jgi:hypothetical protein
MPFLEGYCNSYASTIDVPIFPTLLCPELIEIEYRKVGASEDEGEP